MATHQSIEEQIKKVADKLTQLKARKAAIEARKNAHQLRQSRKEHDRRLFLTGAAVYHLVKIGVLSDAQVAAFLDQGVKREADRVFLGLSMTDHDGTDQASLSNDSVRPTAAISASV